MKVLQRYIASEVIRAVLLALLAFLALFTFLEMMTEVRSLGSGYRIQYAMLTVLLGLPGYAYQLMPLAVLMGTIYALAQLAARSEFTIMRVSSLSTLSTALILIRIGIVFMIAMVIIGELVAPKTSTMAQSVRLQAKGSAISREFQSGSWSKDVIRKDGATGPVIGNRFINIGDIDPSGRIDRLKVYEFDNDLRLNSIIMADHGTFSGDRTWRLDNVTQSDFAYNGKDGEEPSMKTTSFPNRDLITEVTPNILSVLFTDPERMSMRSLYTFIQHLRENNQHTERYDIALWKKLVFPLTIFVMMALALPFAYLHFRNGAVSLKIFCGIMIGVTFEVVDLLFSHLGLLYNWEPAISAILPSLIYLVTALGALWWVERH